MAIKKWLTAEVRIAVARMSTWLSDVAAFGMVAVVVVITVMAATRAAGVGQAPGSDFDRVRPERTALNGGVGRAGSPSIITRGVPTEAVAPPLRRTR